MKDKDVRISYNVWALLRAKTVELSLKSGENITIKGYIDNLILEDLSKKSSERSSLMKKMIYKVRAKKKVEGKI